MTTSDVGGDAPASRIDGATELASDAPEADALEQRLPLVAVDEQDEGLPLELPEDVDPADALDQSLELSGQDEYPADPDFAGQ